MRLQQSMQISITGKQFDVGANLRQHVETALFAIVEKYFGSAIEAHVVISREAHFYRAHLTVHVGRGIQVHAQEASDDAYAAFDVAAAHLGKRLRRHKRRLRDHHKSRNGNDAVEVSSYVLAGPTALDGDDGASNDHPVVIAETTTNIERLSVSEAVMRMDLADLPTMMFRNAGHGGLNVIYRRSDGNIGWIDPQGE
ncbi:MAG: ribosome hibernation-promoting factor, HPF/YfiA family [Alphaproteobacteria bacterium]